MASFICMINSHLNRTALLVWNGSFFANVFAMFKERIAILLVNPGEIVLHKLIVYRTWTTPSAPALNSLWHPLTSRLRNQYWTTLLTLYKESAGGRQVRSLHISNNVVFFHNKLCPERWPCFFVVPKPTGKGNAKFKEGNIKVAQQWGDLEDARGSLSRAEWASFRNTLPNRTGSRQAQSSLANWCPWSEAG